MRGRSERSSVRAGAGVAVPVPPGVPPGWPPGRELYAGAGGVGPVGAHVAALEIRVVSSGHGVDLLIEARGRLRVGHRGEHRRRRGGRGRRRGLVAWGRGRALVAARARAGAAAAGARGRRRWRRRRRRRGLDDLELGELRLGDAVMLGAARAGHQHHDEERVDQRRAQGPPPAGRCGRWSACGGHRWLRHTTPVGHWTGCAAASGCVWMANFATCACRTMSITRTTRP